MKYKYFLMLILLSSISFMGLSSGNVKEKFNKTCCKNKNASGKCTRQKKPVKVENNAYCIIPINQFPLFM